MNSEPNISPLAHLYNLDRLVGDPSKKTLEEIIEEFTLDMVTTSGGDIPYPVARQRVEKTVLAMVSEKRLADLAAAALGEPKTLNRHQKRREKALRRKYSTRNKS